jgi:cytoskeleton protein RodZ
MPKTHSDKAVARANLTLGNLGGKSRARTFMDDPSDESPSDVRPPEPIGMATLLRRARERRGLTLEQVANEIKIPLERLAALEHDTPPHINRGFYQRAHIRAYARAVDLDERVVLAELKREAAPVDPPPVEQPPPVRTRSLGAPHGIMLVVSAALVVGISGIVWEAVTARSTGDHAAIAASAVPERQAVATTGNTPEVVQLTSAPAESTPLVVQSAPLVAVQDTEIRAPEAHTESQPATPTTPAVTELVITTDPVEARVSVNGIGWGSTPITIQHLAPGEKRLRVTKDGYTAVEQITHVVSNRSTTVNIQLQPSP